MRFRKFLLAGIFLLLPVFLWSEASFYWDIGGVAGALKVNQYEVMPDLQLHVGDIYIIGDKSHLALNVEPVVFNLSLIEKESVYPDLPQRDLTGLYLLNTKFAWYPLQTDYVLLGPFASVNYLNPFNIKDLRLYCGAEFSFLLPFNDSDFLGENMLSKMLMVEAGAEFDSTDKFKPSFYAKIGLNFGVFFDMFSSLAQK